MNFDEFMNSLTDTNNTLEFFTDFDKVNSNVSKIELKLNQLNYLIGKSDIKLAVYELYEENKKVFSILNILIAVRDNKRVLDKFGKLTYLNSYFEDGATIVNQDDLMVHVR